MLEHMQLDELEKQKARNEAALKFGTRGRRGPSADLTPNPDLDHFKTIDSVVNPPSSLEKMLS
jgi:hypothetical protein